ncbi:hypothetical protein BWI15_35270 [Kribbella sp. ALI-6-A]|uniref:hypothetical protein n=1 Tax=Kribbella sp. ALI-6-A TaxID=1933817 RepID=UPI00097BF1E5|nr:hypothetical protein [Kribbella sp. ALI-6-A]ONI68281.1 hypothetical protein BWI15_35270 [Kribbella sp. ALI-6-A]
MREIRIDTTEGSVGEPERWLPFLARELREPDSFVIVSDGRRDSYAQARNAGRTLEMEYRDGSPLRHFQARGVGLDDVADLFAQWIEKERAFIDRYQWERLKDWDDHAANGQKDEDGVGTR